ncbi:MAG: sigma-70 family RNA polymerase sigma factor [Dehalococcoidia bacterium]|nr:sigma-70 family RNA polymerase sigma factor [Dehalococcoidia bacterium]
MPDDESLVRQARAGDSAAFTSIYEIYFDRVYRYIAIRTSNRTDAEDLTEQVFLRCVESIGGYKWRGAPFAAWLFRIAHNLLIDHHRKGKGRETVPLEDFMGVDETDPDEAVELKLDVERLRRAMPRLTEAQRQAIACRFIAELSIAETAQAMGKSEGAVKALQHSGLLALRRIMTRPAGDTGTESNHG